MPHFARAMPRSSRTSRRWRTLFRCCYETGVGPRGSRATDALTTEREETRASRLLHVLENRLLPAIFGELSPLELTAFLVRSEPISYADAVLGKFAQIKIGDPW